MNHIRLRDLKQLNNDWTLLIHNAEGNIYLASAEFSNGECQRIVTNQGRPLLGKSLTEIKELLGLAENHSTVLVPHQAYDEMIHNNSVAHEVRNQLN